MKSLILLLVMVVAIACTAGAQTISVPELIGKMSLEEKVGQMTQAARDYLAPGDVTKYFLGSVLSGGGSGPKSNMVGEWRKMVGKFQDEALATRLKIPMIYGIDAVHGHNTLRNATIFPHNIGLGAAGDADLVFRIERATSEELKATGIPWTFAPCVAVVQDLRWGRTYEGFSRDPVLSAKLADAAVRGFQGETLGETGVSASVKHFVADGGTKGGVDQGDAQLTQAQLDTIFLPPYAAAVGAHTGTIMASFSSINGIKMHANKDLLTGWLKGKQKFDGFIVSDWAGVKQLPGSPEDQIAAAINAGIDMVMVPDNYPEFINSLIKNVKSGAVPLARINDAVARILTVKLKLGLFQKPMPESPMNLPAHTAIAKEAVQKSFTLLKNDGVLPLKPGAKILVLGQKADDIGSLCGGWTMTWQGSPGNITKGETVLAGLVRRFGSANVRFSPDGDIPENFVADLVVFLVGESPYAEMEGDSSDLLPDASDLAIYKNWKEKQGHARLPLVSLVVSGRPLVMNDLIAESNAVAAIWLPGSQAGSVAEVLAGDRKPVAKLPHPWPVDAAQTKSAWPLGFGLGY